MPYLSFQRLDKQADQVWYIAITPFILLSDNFVEVIIRFRVQFGINLHEWVFQKAEIARAASASAISLFEKLTSAN